MGLFTDLYQTVAKFFRPQEELDGDASKSVATNRLKLVLMQDRTNLTPKILEQMRGELVDLLSKYLEMDKELLELNFEQEGDQVALMLSIPVIRAKDEEEIEEALKASRKNEDTDEDLDEDEIDDELDESDSDEVEDNDEDVESVEDVEANNQEDADECVSENSDEDDEEIVPKRKRTKKISQTSELSSNDPEKEQNTEVITEE